MYWKSKLMNSELALLSTAEAEFMALSIALRGRVIPLMTQMEEIHKVFPLYINKPNFHCKVWEDNQLCICHDSQTHFTPRTEHIALKYDHFMSYVGTRRSRTTTYTLNLKNLTSSPNLSRITCSFRFELSSWDGNLQLMYLLPFR